MYRSRGRTGSELLGPDIVLYGQILAILPPNRWPMRTAAVAAVKAVAVVTMASILARLIQCQGCIQLQTTETIGMIKRQDSNGKWMRMIDKLIWLNVESIINIRIQMKHYQCVLN